MINYDTTNLLHYTRVHCTNGTVKYKTCAVRVGANGFGATDLLHNSYMDIKPSHHFIPDFGLGTAGTSATNMLHQEVLFECRTKFLPFGYFSHFSYFYGFLSNNSAYFA